MNTEFVSIVMTTYRTPFHQRDEMARKSIDSLLQNTTFPYEFILIDNTQNNRGLGIGRNTGFSMASGDIICFTDDDIWFKEGWLEECVKMIKMGDKLIATPVHQPRVSRWEMADYLGYRRNYRTGSNCMVMWKKDFLEIGKWIEGFDPKTNVVKIGHRYSDWISQKGYSFLITKLPLAIDMGLGLHSYGD